MNDYPPTMSETTGQRLTNSGEGIGPPLALDPDEYREHLEDFDLTAEQENELLAVLWNIMRTFVDIGFGLDSVQVFSTGKPGEAVEISGPDSGNALRKKNTPQRFNQAACHSGDKED